VTLIATDADDVGPAGAQHGAGAPKLWFTAAVVLNHRVHTVPANSRHAVPSAH